MRTFLHYAIFIGGAYGWAMVLHLVLVNRKLREDNAAAHRALVVLHLGPPMPWAPRRKEQQPWTN